MQFFCATSFGLCSFVYCIPLYLREVETLCRACCGNSHSDSRWTSAYLSPKIGDRISQLQQPESRPVTQITASLHLFIKGHAPFPYLPQNKDQEGNIAHLSLGELARWQPGKSAPWVLWLSARDPRCWSSTTEAHYYAEFTAEPVFNRINEPAGEFLQHLDLFDLFPNFLPINTHIDGGALIVRVNSLLSKSLPIPSQDFREFQNIADEWSLAHPSPVIELHPSPAPTQSP